MLIKQGTTYSGGRADHNPSSIGTGYLTYTVRENKEWPCVVSHFY
jgi:hypothetical protein